MHNAIENSLKLLLVDFQKFSSIPFNQVEIGVFQVFSCDIHADAVCLVQDMKDVFMHNTQAYVELLFHFI
jgi:hypothetical protein